MIIWHYYSEFIRFIIFLENYFIENIENLFINT